MAPRRNRVADAWQRGQGLDTRPRAVDVDGVLHEQCTVDLDAPVPRSSS